MGISSIKKTREYLIHEIVIAIILWILILISFIRGYFYTGLRDTSGMVVVEGILHTKYNTDKGLVLVLENGIQLGFEEVLMKSNAVDMEGMLEHIEPGDHLQLLVDLSTKYNYVYALSCNGKEYLTSKQTFMVFKESQNKYVFIAAMICILYAFAILYKIFCLTTGKYCGPKNSCIETRIAFTGQICEIKVRKGDYVKKNQTIMVAKGKIGLITTGKLEIKSNTNGVVENINVKIGDIVKKFELLATIRYK